MGNKDNLLENEFNLEEVKIEDTNYPVVDVWPPMIQYYNPYSKIEHYEHFLYKIMIDFYKEIEKRRILISNPGVGTISVDKL